MSDLDQTIGVLLQTYGARETLLALARGLAKEGLLPLAGKVRAMLPPEEHNAVNELGDEP